MNSNASQERPLPHIPVMVTEVFKILKPAAQWNLPGWYNRGGRARHRNPQSTFQQRKVNRD